MEFNFTSAANKTFITCFFFILSGLSLTAQVTPTVKPNFSESQISSGWNQVVGFQYDAAGRMYVWEKGGKVWLVKANGVKNTTPVIDLSDEVGNWRDHGLNGFALDPDFNNNGYIYLYYTVDYYALKNKFKVNYSTTTNTYYKATIARVTRYTCNAADGFATVNLNTRLVLIGKSMKDGIPVLHTSHSGGSLVFGDDGSLLISTGDGSSFNQVDTGNATTSYWSDGLTDSIIRPAENVGSFRSQMVNSYNGKILRIDKTTGLGLPSNPFYDPARPDAPKSKVWCLGFRNPFRFSLRKGSGSTDITAGQPGVLYIGEVGWQLLEELNVSKTGAENFGWPFYEGVTPHTGYFGSEVVNLDEANTITDTNDCDLDYYKFRQLLIQDTLGTDSIFRHPCDWYQLIPASSHPFKNSRPALDWHHNISQTRVPIFDTTGTASYTSISSPTSPVTGSSFLGNASVGGFFNNDIRLSSTYYNTYFHADYGQGWIKNIMVDKDNNLTKVEPFAENLGAIVYLTVNPNNGCLTYVKYPDQIRKICYTGVINYPPTARAQSDKTYGPSPLTVSFGDSLSSDPDNVNLNVVWYFGNGDSSIVHNPTYTFTDGTGTPQTYKVILKVTDGANQKSYDTLRIFLNNTPPQVDIISLPDTFVYTTTKETLLNLRANASDAQSPQASLAFKWQTTLFHNNHNHPDPFDTDKETTVKLSPLGCDGETYFYHISLSVCDEQGLCSQAMVVAYPDCQPSPVLNGGFTVSAKTVCRTTNITFTDTTKFATSWHWYFPGAFPTEAFTQSPVINYSSAGTFPVYLVVKNDITQDSVVRLNYIQVKSLPTISGITNYGTDTMCGPGSFYLKANTPNTNVLYQWLKNGQPVFAAFDDSLLVDTTGTYTVVVTNTNGCTSSLSKTIYSGTNITLTISTSHPLYICSSTDSAYLFTVNNAQYSYQWKKNGVNISGATKYYYYVKTKGTYTLQVNANSTCTNILQSNSLVFVTHPNVAFSVSGSLSFCNGDSVTLGSSSCGSCLFKWYKDNSRMYGVPTTSNKYVAKTTGKYQLKVEDGMGCSLYSSKWNVVVNPVFTVTASGPLTFCNGDSVVLTVTSNPKFHYAWKRNSTWLTNATSNKLTIKTDGQYYCKVTDTTSACSQRTTYQNVTINCRIGEAVANGSLEISPNPAKGITTLSFGWDSQPEAATISLYNMTGELVWQKEQVALTGFNEVEMDIKTIPDGVYELRLKVREVNYESKKFVKLQ